MLVHLAEWYARHERLQEFRVFWNNGYHTYRLTYREAKSLVGTFEALQGRIVYDPVRGNNE